VSGAKTAKVINLPFGLWTLVGQRKHKFNRIHQVVSMSLAPPGKYDWTVRQWRLCGLM